MYLLFSLQESFFFTKYFFKILVNDSAARKFFPLLGNNYSLSVITLSRINLCEKLLPS